MLLKKKTKIAPFTLNPRAPVQVIHRSGAPVLSLLRFRDGFIASQGGSGASGERRFRVVQLNIGLSARSLGLGAWSSMNARHTVLAHSVYHSTL